MDGASRAQRRFVTGGQRLLLRRRWIGVDGGSGGARLAKRAGYLSQAHVEVGDGLPRVQLAHQVFNTGVQAETGVTSQPVPCRGPSWAADPVLREEAFRWSPYRAVSKTATVSLAGNREQVAPPFIGQFHKGLAGPWCSNHERRLVEMLSWVSGRPCRLRPSFDGGGWRRRGCGGGWR